MSLLSNSSNLVNWLHEEEIPLVIMIQKSTPALVGSGLQLYTEWIHPSMALSVVFPFLLGLGRRATALHLMLVFLSSEVANLVLKWALAGDRPYWASAQVEQFPMTCEGGFGMPSGHMQAFTTVSYFLLSRLRAPWSAFLIHAPLVLIGSLSRIVTGSHFPSQTLLGWMVGAGFGIRGNRLLAGQCAKRYLGPSSSSLFRASFLSAYAIGCALLIVLTYMLLDFSGRDPRDSLAYAQAACTSQRGVVGLVIETSGTIFGALMGVAGVSMVCSFVDDLEPLTPMRFATAGLGVAMYSQTVAECQRWAKALAGAPEPPHPIFLAAAVGFARIVLTAPLPLLSPLLSLATRKLR